MHQFWQAVFGNDRPVEVEIGPGTGTFVLAAAHSAPHTNFYGLERSRSRAARLQSKIEVCGLRNTRVIAADASCVVGTLVPSESVSAYHIYFPDPWWKRRHHRRRLFTLPFVAALARTLAPGGRIFLATDVEEVFSLMLDTLQMRESLRQHSPVHSARRILTAFERKGIARGATIKEAVFVKWKDHTSSAAPMTPAESPSTLRQSGVRSSSLNT